MKVLREDIRKNSFEELQYQKANIQFLMSYFQNPIPLRSYDIIEFENLKNIIINSLNSVFNNLKNENIQENKIKILKGVKVMLKGLTRALEILKQEQVHNEYEKYLLEYLIFLLEKEIQKNKLTLK